MSVSRLADRYAKSLMDLAVEDGKLDVVLGDIKAFQKMLCSKDLVNLIKSPIVPSSKKEQIFKALFEGKVDTLTNTFFNVILRKGREEFLPDIANNFVDQYKAHMGITDVRLTTASALSDENIAAIKAALVSSNVVSDKVELISKVDPNILGGFVIEVGDNLYNNSVAHKLHQIKKQFA